MGDARLIGTEQPEAGLVFAETAIEHGGASVKDLESFSACLWFDFLNDDSVIDFLRKMSVVGYTGIYIQQYGEPVFVAWCGENIQVAQVDLAVAAWDGYAVYMVTGPGVGADVGEGQG